MSRAELMAAFLAANGWPGAEPRPLAADASFRRYLRLGDGSRRAVLMDAPPPMEDVRPFVLIARHLARLGLSAPAILAEDAGQGFLLIEDLGDDTYTRLIARGAPEQPLYALAVDTLAVLHRHRDGAAIELRRYDEALLLAEVLLFTDWFMPAVGLPLPAAARDDYIAAWRTVLRPLATAPPALVLRDYHVDNLMLLPERPGVAACGLLDFQDAVIGHPGYDLVSLLEDARRDLVDPGLQRTMLARYLDSFPAIDRDRFAADCALLAAQRHAKVIGIFTRLCRRDGKPQYLPHIGRVWRLLTRHLDLPAMAPVSAWLDAYVPRDFRRGPTIEEARAADRD